MYHRDCPLAVCVLPPLLGEVARAFLARVTAMGGGASSGELFIIIVIIAMGRILRLGLRRATSLAAVRKERTATLVSPLSSGSATPVRTPHRRG